MERQAIYTAHDLDDLVERGQIWNFHDEDTQEYLHGLHPYPAKFIPQIPRLAIDRWSKAGELVYDPFCGCGTTLLEASFLGRPSVGTDNNSVAVLISAAKIAPYTSANLARLDVFAATLAERLKTAPTRPDLVPENKNFPYWYSEKVIERLSVLKGIIYDEVEPVRSLLLAVFSSILVKVSFQDSDTRYARIDRAVSRANVDNAFRAKLQDVQLRLPALARPARSTSLVFQSDARAVPMVRSESVALLVTSPPYLNAYDYHKYHRQRLHWIEGDVAFARDVEIGSHDQFTRPKATPDAYFDDMNACFAEWGRVIRRGGYAVVVIGDAIVSKAPVQVADTFVTLLAGRGLQLQDRWVRQLQATKRAFNVRNSRITHEHMLLFRRD